MYAGIASACLAGMLVLTFAGNMPINVAVLRWAEPGDPHEWRSLRRRWDAIHPVRITLDSAAFVLWSPASGVTVSSPTNSSPEGAR